MWYRTLRRTHVIIHPFIDTHKRTHLLSLRSLSPLFPCMSIEHSKRRCYSVGSIIMYSVSIEERAYNQDASIIMRNYKNKLEKRGKESQYDAANECQLFNHFRIEQSTNGMIWFRRAKKKLSQLDCTENSQRTIQSHIHLIFHTKY